MNMDNLHVDFRTHGRTCKDDRGCFYEASNRALVILENHECVEDIIATIIHESLHFCMREEENIDEGHVVGQVEEDYIVPAVVEELNTEEEIIEPTISPEAIESATSDLKDLFEVIAGIDLSTGVKIEPPKLEPTRYDIMDEISTVLTGSRVDEAKPFLDNVSINGNGVERKEVASNILTKDWNPRIENAKAAQVIVDVTNLLEKHKNILKFMSEIYFFEKTILEKI